MFFGLADGDADILQREGIFLSYIHITLAGADRVGADHQSLQDGMRITFQHGPIHEGPRVTLICVDDHILLVARDLLSGLPLDARGEASPAPAPQSGFFNFLYDFPGRHPGEHPCQGGIAAQRQVVIDILGIDPDVVADDISFLVLVERNLGFMAQLFIVTRIDEEQAIDHLVLLDGLADNFGNVFRCDLQITGLFRFYHHDGAFLAKTWTPGSLDLDLPRQALFFHFRM